MTDQKSKVNKFLGLLKTAQNSAFVSLVCDNLKVELDQKPWKALRIVDNLLREIPTANSDFTRLKLAEGLIPLLNQCAPPQFPQALISHATSEKRRQKLTDSFLILDVSSSSTNRAIFSFSDMLKCRKNFFSDLFENYQPLLAELSMPDTQQKAETTSKDNVKQMFLEGALGSRLKTDKLKLSDFIDESFFEDCDIPMEYNTGATQQNLYLKDLLTEMKRMASSVFMSDATPHVAKRQKTSHGVESRPAMALMSPALAIVMHVLVKDCLVDSDWKVRQAAANNVRIALKQGGFTYTLISSEYTLGQRKEVSVGDIAKTLIPQIFIVLMKDHFNDFEELKVLTPVREVFIDLLNTIIDMRIAEDEIGSLIQLLPLLLRSVDSYAGDSWITKYNFFLLIKALLACESPIRNTVFQMFSRVLIESLLNLEDEVRIIVTDIINLVLPLMLEQPDYEKSISYLLKNLQSNLKQCDEIESSAISVFSLITRIIDIVPNLQKLSFTFDIATFCPFNFHKIVNVRFSYLQILNKCLQTGTPFSPDDLQTLFKLTLQSLAMERSKPIVKLNLANLRLLSVKEDVIQEAFDTYLPRILYSFQFDSFDDFIFLESKNFESINRDYFKVVFRPVTQDELSQFYFGKMRNMSKALAVLMERSSTVVQKNLFCAPPIKNAHLLYLLCVCNVVKSGRAEVLDTSYIGELVSYYISQLTEDQICFDECKDYTRLQELMLVLRQSLGKYPKKYQSLLQVFQPFDQMITTCYIEQKLTNIAAIQQYVDRTLSPAFVADLAPELLECFKEIKSLISSIIEYGIVACSRIKQVSAIIHVDLASQGSLQLTSQLNNLIKPVLNQIKKEGVTFLQSLACKSSVNLVSLLIKAGKPKPAQQILSLLVKDAEQIKYPDGSGNDVQDRGITCVMKQIAKGGNIFQAFNNHLGHYLAQPITLENFLPYSRVLAFTLKFVTDEHLYSKEKHLISQQVCQLISLNQAVPEIPQLVIQVFSIFKSEQLITSIVHAMQDKSKVGFDCLMRLLDEMSAQQSSAMHALKYIPVFVIPVIRNIQYSRLIFADDKQITLILAQLLSLLPLNLASLTQSDTVMVDEERKDGEMSQLGGDLQVLAKEGLNFLQVFVNNQIGAEDYKMHIRVKANLRDYQLQGITWLASLGHYNLNCALCDDMGLGKTLQSLCVVLNESYLRRQKKPINLIVCPTTITYNWQAEIKKYFDGIRIGIYEGTSQQKTEIVKKPGNYDVIIISYEKLRNEIKQFSCIPFFYVILDEAHIIKNGKAKITQAVKSLQCEKKIVLTGTPLQNKVSELWSIFDFLMPGFLEEEGVFNKKYNQYLTSNIKKLSEKLEETQSFVNALKSLKKRISPFILRRTKDQVLKELPPKIIQDVICKMTTFQEYVHKEIDRLYPISKGYNQEQMDKPQIKKAGAGNQILQNLILHRKVCNHPMLVAKECSNDKTIASYIRQKSEQEQMSYEHSGKLLGLIDKLVECEIIVRPGEKEESKIDQSQATDMSLLLDMAQTSIDVSAKSSSKHRALIFCQMGTFLKMIRDEVLIKFKVPYLELLSSHSSKDRLDIVDRFNQDESISVLILTTAVGGLGLTLTGADTVIFAEHDWNPMRDLQAIDRAHRIGQTRQVCVYRLIVQGTLEETIMNLQRFKENLARSLVQSRDTSVEKANNMELTDLLSSFQEHSAFAQNEENAKKKSAKQNSFQDKMISNIEEIWQGGAFSVEDL